MQVRLAAYVSIVLSILLPAQMAIAETPKPAFASPDGRQVPFGTWQVFFTPSNLEPLSYLPSQLPSSLNVFSSVLPPCSGNQNACVESIQYQIDGGTWESAISGPDEGQRAVAYGTIGNNNEFLLTYTSKFPEDVVAGRPEGSTPRLWSFAKGAHAAGRDYQVAANFRGLVQPDGKYSINSFNLEVNPVTRIPGNREDCLQPSIWEERANQSRDGYCKTIYDFPKNLRIKVTLKLGAFLEKIQGWYDGRLKEASIKVVSQSKTIEIEGYPLNVPTAATRPIPFGSIPRNYTSQPTPDVIAIQRGMGTAGKPEPNSAITLQEFTTMLPDMLPKALGENSIWRISSVASINADNCLQPGIVNGLVTTNATVYNSAAPKWVPRSSSLDFKVAATHLDPSGQIFRGYYKMILSEKVAECYWGPDFSKGTASISITNQEGSPNIATTNLGSRDGWISFEAAGFNFSAPTISAIIKPAPRVIVAPKPTPVATPTPVAKTKTITCISPNKKLKNVKGVNPKCPSGYKKK